MTRWKIEIQEWFIETKSGYRCRIWRYAEPKFYWKVGERPGGWRVSGSKRTLRAAKRAVEAAINKLTIKKIPKRKVT